MTHPEYVNLPWPLAMAQLDTAIRDLVAFTPLEPLPGGRNWNFCRYCLRDNSTGVLVHDTQLCAWWKARDLIGLTDEETLTDTRRRR